MISRGSFEKSYAEAHDLPIETFKDYRMGDTYRLPMIAKCWRFWQLGSHAGSKQEEPVNIAYADGCMVCGEWGGHFGLPCPKMVPKAQSELPETRTGQIGAPSLQDGEVMDANKIRTEFEAAFVDEQVRKCGEGFRGSAIYMIEQDNVIVRNSWWAWQASRETLVVELPKIDDPDCGQRVSCHLGAYKVQCRQAIEAQGLKVKP